MDWEAATWSQRPSGEASALACLLTPDAQLLVPMPSHPTWVVLPKGNERYSGKSAPKPRPAHILDVESHQRLFTRPILSIEESWAPHAGRIPS